MLALLGGLAIACRHDGSHATRTAAIPKAPPCGTSFSADELEQRATAPLDAIAVQLDTESTFVFAPPFARRPIFTLYRDGAVFYRATPDSDAELLTARLPNADVDTIVAHVMELGFPRLRSHVEECSCPTQCGAVVCTSCTSDGDYTILRVRPPSGEIQQVAVYAGQWNEVEVASKIIDYLTTYRAKGARTYVPSTATLITEKTNNRASCMPVDRELEKELEIQPSAGASGVPMSNNMRPISNGALRALLDKVGSGGGEAYLCSSLTAYHVRVYPWLPGANLAPAIDRWRRRLEAHP